MVFAIYLLLITTVLMVIGGIPLESGDVTIVFKSPVFMICGLLLALSSFLACFKVRFLKKNIAFFINHLSIVAIITGVFLSIFLEKKGEFRSPLGKDYVIEVVPQPSGKNTMRPVNNDIPLGFGISFSDFEVSYFDPSFARFKMVQKDNGIGEMYDDYEYVETAQVKDCHLIFSDGLTVEKSALINGFTNEWRTQVPLEDQSILQLNALMDKEYHVTANIYDEERNLIDSQLMKINHPVDHGGWRFYLMSYDKKEKRHVTILAKRDPGAPFVTYGLWILLLGVFLFSTVQLLTEVKNSNAN